MAKTHRSGIKPPDEWRCMIEGCEDYGVWQPIVPGEEFLHDTTDPRSHYWTKHYVESERRYQIALAEQRQRRLEHYRLTGEILPPEF